VLPDKLRLSREEMRSLGYAVIDTLIEHCDAPPQAGPGVQGSRPALEAILREPPPARGADPLELLRLLEQSVFSTMRQVDHPRFFAFVPSPGNFVSAMADALASGFNSFVGTWFSGSGPSEVELVTMDWLRELCGLPETAGGLTVSGGSVANLTALALARNRRLGYDLAEATIYFSDQTHSSVDRALRLLGFAPAQTRRLTSDANFRLPLAALAREVAADRALGRRPFCVVANAGATNTGAVDPLPELVEFCRREKIWLHADGAYGAAAVLCAEGKRALEGLGEVDSLSLDPHKWLFQPFEIGCVLVRDRDWLKNAFRITPEYLRDVHRFEEEVNFCDYGIELTRGFRALKLWLSLKTFGLDAFAAAIEYGIRMAEFAERRLRERGDWEVVSPAQLAVVTFRYAPADRPRDELDALNQKLVAAALADGFATVTSTTLRGNAVLRLCTINPRTTEADILETIDRLERLAG
jgi:aromatic-L-amino-acid/L-tryptophan decarboxylase